MPKIYGCFESNITFAHCTVLTLHNLVFRLAVTVRLLYDIIKYYTCISNRFTELECEVTEANDALTECKIHFY